MFEERRQYKRYKSRIMMTTLYRNEKDGINVEENVFSEDISAGGLKIVLPHHLAKDKILDLKLFLFSDPIPLSTKGKVAWSSQRQRLEFETANKNDQENNLIFWAGIQFIDIDPFTQERIIRWIKKKEAQ